MLETLKAFSRVLCYLLAYLFTSTDLRGGHDINKNVTRSAFMVPSRLELRGLLGPYPRTVGKL